MKEWKVGNNIAGQAISFDNLTFAVVYEAGHEVPYYQPINSSDMFTRWINNVPLTAEPKVKRKMRMSKRRTLQNI